MNMRELMQAVKSSRELRELLLKDPYRPGYHFVMPEDKGVPGDPNGAFYANGRYHLMYLYDRRGGKFWHEKCFCWGHISSIDLVHWRHHPDSISPGHGDGGCFSGGAFVDNNNVAYLSYWALPTTNESFDGGIGIAKSSDRHYETWEKFSPTPIPCTEFGILDINDSDGNINHVGNADPSNIWQKDDVYYMQAGNKAVLDKYGREKESPQKYKGDWVDLFKSYDLKSWEFVHRFYHRDINNNWTAEGEDDMCPSFLPLPLSKDGGKDSGKYLQLFISHNKGCQYYIGEYDKSNDLFIPESHGRMSWNDNTFFAPEALIDDKNRQIMWAWLLDSPEVVNHEFTKCGWSGIYCLPRTIWLGNDNTLRIAPIDELEILRYNHKEFPAVKINDNQNMELLDINGESCEIELVVSEIYAEKIGLQVRTSPDGEETTLLYYDSSKKQLVFDSTKSGKRGRLIKETAPFELKESEKLVLRIFIDKSVIEIFANDRQAIARRVYPECSDSNNIFIFCENGNAHVETIKTWEMMPSNPH